MNTMRRKKLPALSGSAFGPFMGRVTIDQNVETQGSNRKRMIDPGYDTHGITHGNVSRAARLARRERTKFYKLLRRHHPQLFRSTE